jgi:hypothetical protein
MAFLRELSLARNKRREGETVTFAVLYGGQAAKYCGENKKKLSGAALPTCSVVRINQFKIIFFVVV